MLIVQMFQIKHEVTCALITPDQFIQLELKGLSVTVLGALNEENHQKSHNCRARVNHKLPRIAVTKPGSRSRPDNNE